MLAYFKDLTQFIFDLVSLRQTVGWLSGDPERIWNSHIRNRIKKVPWR